jgi:hypothetical protein
MMIFVIGYNAVFSQVTMLSVEGSMIGAEYQD